MTYLMTTSGPLTLAELPGVILPHEHIFVDLRTPEQLGPGEAVMPATGDVVRLMAPELARARDAGVAALVECTPAGVGRYPEAVLAVAEAAAFPVVMPTGVYREPWVPAWVKEASVAALRDWMLTELLEGIGETGVQAGWIKLSAGDDGITPIERKILRAAAVAGAETGAVIGSHTIRGRVVLDQLSTLEKAGHTVDRYIWIHAHSEPDLAYHEEVANRGGWLEYDAIGSQSIDDETFVVLILRMLERGFEDQLLLSHDRGWYDPAKPGGGEPLPFTYLNEVFLSKLRAAGVDDGTADKLTRLNPYHAFAR
jgi:phosphotriesterase-related protein